MGCGLFCSNRFEVCLDEDDSRSSSRVREHGSFLLVSQLHVANTLKSVSISLRCVNKPMVCSHLTGLSMLNNWVFDYGWVCWEFFTTSSNFSTQFFHPSGLSKQSSEVEMTHLTFSYMTSPVSIMIVFDDTVKLGVCRKGWLLSIVFFEIFNPFFWTSFVSTLMHRVLMSLPLCLVIPCKTRCIQLNCVRISVFFHKIHKRGEYRLSFAQILSSWCQSWFLWWSVN